MDDLEATLDRNAEELGLNGKRETKKPDTPPDDKSGSWFWSIVIFVIVLVIVVVIVYFVWRSRRAKCEENSEPVEHKPPPDKGTCAEIKVDSSWCNRSRAKSPTPRAPYPSATKTAEDF
jgi:hypothetical protein